MSHIVFDQIKKVELEAILGLAKDSLSFQPTLRFSPGTSQLAEELHHETSYEVLVPLDGPLHLKISPSSAENRTETWEAFREVEVDSGQGVVILPRYCHKVLRAGKFMVLKPTGSFKISRDAKTKEGECPYQGECASRELCPSPERESQ